MGAVPAGRCTSCRSRDLADDLQDVGDEPIMVSDDTPIEQLSVFSGPDARPSAPSQEARRSRRDSMSSEDGVLRTVSSSIIMSLSLQSFVARSGSAEDASPRRGMRSVIDTMEMDRGLDTRRQASEGEASISMDAEASWFVWPANISKTSSSAVDDSMTSAKSWFGWATPTEDPEEAPVERCSSDKRMKPEKSWRDTFWRAGKAAKANVARMFHHGSDHSRHAADRNEAQAQLEEFRTQSLHSSPDEAAKAASPVDLRKKAQANALSLLCKKHGLSCGIVWTLHREKRNVFVADREASHPGVATGYFTASTAVEFAVAQSDSIVSRVWTSQANELIPNVYYLDSFARKPEALHHNIRTVFAICGKDVVYEFATSQEMWKLPFEVVDVEAINLESSSRKDAKRAARPPKKQNASASMSMASFEIAPDELEQICEQHGLCCCIVWVMEKRGVLTVDEDASYTGTAPDFVEQCCAVRLPIGEDIAGRVWESRCLEHAINVQRLPLDAYARLELAKLSNMKTCFALYHDSRVFEFYTTEELNTCPFQTLQR